MIDTATERRYEGEFEEDQPIGNGTIYYPNGDIFTGKVDKLVRQGPGQLYCAET